jgi:hypothetical protein
MLRRDFLKGTLMAGIVSGVAPAPAQSERDVQYLQLTWFRCRRDLDLQRLRSFLGDSVLKVYNRAGIKPVGVFQVSVGPDSPSFLVVAPHPSMAAVQETRAKFALDQNWTKELKTFEEKWDLAYESLESSLIQGFRTFPAIEVPKVETGKNNVFELRIYESRNLSAHEKKVAMFDGGEIDIFRRSGILPVFFGSTIFGTRMPNLTYLVYYPSWEARAEAWSKFGQDPDWKKLSTMPGNSDRELVTRISNQILIPLPFSQIR